MCSKHIVSLPLSPSDQGINSQRNVYWFIGVDHCPLKQEWRWPRAHKGNEGSIFRGERILRSPEPHPQHHHQPSTATDLIYTQLASSKSSNRAMGCWMGYLVALQVITKTVLLMIIHWAWVSLPGELTHQPEKELAKSRMSLWKPLMKSGCWLTQLAPLGEEVVNLNQLSTDIYHAKCSSLSWAYCTVGVSVVMPIKNKWLLLIFYWYSY